MAFGADGAARVGADMLHFLPWVLDSADRQTTDTILGLLPEHAQQTYRRDWQPAYAARDWWDEG
jgi:hypothetical protein